MSANISFSLFNAAIVQLHRCSRTCQPLCVSKYSCVCVCQIRPLLQRSMHSMSVMNDTSVQLRYFASSPSPITSNSTDSTASLTSCVRVVVTGQHSGFWFSVNNSPFGPFGSVKHLSEIGAAMRMRWSAWIASAMFDAKTCNDDIAASITTHAAISFKSVDSDHFQRRKESRSPPLDPPTCFYLRANELVIRFNVYVCMRMQSGE